MLSCWPHPAVPNIISVGAEKGTPQPQGCWPKGKQKGKSVCSELLTPHAFALIQGVLGFVTLPPGLCPGLRAGRAIGLLLNACVLQLCVGGS